MKSIPNNENTEKEKISINTFDRPQIKTADYDILIIEDDPSTIDLLTRFYKSKGNTVKGIQTGSNGLDELKLKIEKGLEKKHLLKTISLWKGVNWSLIVSIPIWLILGIILAKLL